MVLLSQWIVDWTSYAGFLQHVPWDYPWFSMTIAAMISNYYRKYI